MLKFYGYKKCSTCRKAEKALEKLNQPFEFIDITEAPPPLMILKKVVKQSGVALSKFFNTSGVQYRDLKIKEKVATLTETQILERLAENGRLLKRPIVTDGAKCTVGFEEAVFLKTWK